MAKIPGEKGKCLLCLNHLELRQSHLVSDFALRSLNKNFVLLKNDYNVTVLDKQDFVIPRFCDKCENQMSKYESFFKSIFFSNKPTLDTFKIEKERDPTSYLLFGIDPIKLQLMLETHIYRVSILNQKGGLNSSDKGIFYTNGTKNTFLKTRLDRDVASAVRKGIVDGIPSNRLILKAVYHLYPRPSIERAEGLALAQMRGFTTPTFNSENPIWCIVFLNMAFVVEEDIPSLRRNKFYYDFQPIENSDVLTIHTGLLEGILDSLWNKKTFPYGKSSLPIRKALQQGNRCLLCFTQKETNSYACCVEHYLDDTANFQFDLQNNGYYIRPVIKANTVHNNAESNETVNKELTQIWCDVTGKKELLYGWKPMVSLSKDYNLLQTIKQIQIVLKSRASTKA